MEEVQETSKESGSKLLQWDRSDGIYVINGKCKKFIYLGIFKAKIIQISLIPQRRHEYKTATGFVTKKKSKINTIHHRVIVI